MSNEREKPHASVVCLEGVWAASSFKTQPGLDSPELDLGELMLIVFPYLVSRQWLVVFSKHIPSKARQEKFKASLAASEFLMFLNLSLKISAPLASPAADGQSSLLAQAWVGSGF